MNKDILKYGIGIVADMTAIDFDARVFEHGNMNVVVDNLKVKKISTKECEEKLKNWKIQKVEKRKEIVDVRFYKQNAIEPTDIVTFFIPKTVDKPVHIYIGDKQKNVLIYLRIIVEAGARVTIIESIQDIEYCGMILDVIVGEGAYVKYIIDQRVDDKSFLIHARTAFVGKNAIYRWIDIELGSAISKQTIVTELVDEGARAETYGLFFGIDNQLIDLKTTILHNASHTTSDMHVKGVLSGHAKGIYYGLIRIPHGSYTCDGKQREETLLLSKDSEINSIPNLEIENNDVKCRHAVSTANIDTESLFYFQSRGIENDTAIQSIVEGYLMEIIDLVGDETLMKSIKSTIIKKLK